MWEGGLPEADELGLLGPELFQLGGHARLRQHTRTTAQTNTHMIIHQLRVGTRRT